MIGCVRALLAIVLIALVSIPAARIPSAQADEAVPARGWSHGDYGRFVLDWSKSVQASVSADGKELTISFDRAANIDPKSAIANLKSYVSAARRGRDGKSITLTLNEPVTWRLFQDGTHLVVDMALVGQRKFANGPGKSQSPPPKTAAKRSSGSHRLLPLVAVAQGRRPNDSSDPKQTFIADALDLLNHRRADRRPHNDADLVEGLLSRAAKRSNRPIAEGGTGPASLRKAAVQRWR